METLIYICIALMIGYVVGLSLKSPVKPPQIRKEENEKQDEKVENEDAGLYVLTEEDENRVIKYALKQFKYSYEKPELSIFHKSRGSFVSSYNFYFYIYLKDLSIRIYVDGPIRWECDTETQMMTECAKYFYEKENPFEKVKVELGTHKDEDTVEVTDWKTVEKFVDIMYDKVYGKNFRNFVRDLKDENAKIAAFCKERDAKLYKEIGIRQK